MVFFKDLQKYGGYIHYAAKARLKEELGGSKLGWVWWIIEPAAFMLIYLFVFTVVFHRTTQYTVAFIFIGISLWRFFNGTIQSAVTAVKRNRKLLSQVYLPKFALVLITMATYGVKLGFSFLAAAGLLAYYRIMPSFSMLQILPVFGVVFLTTFGLSLMVLHIGVYLEDLGSALRPAMQLLFYASGVFYPMEQVWDQAATEVLLWVNPLALVISEARRALLSTQVLRYGPLAFWALLGAMVTALGLWLTYRYERGYLKIL